MPWSMAQLYLALPAFLLVLFRVSGLMLAAPFFSSAVLPTQLKVLLSVAIALAIFPLTVAQVAVPVTLGSALAGLLGELAIGLFIGFTVSLVFMGVQMAIDLVSHQSGLMLGNVFNPLLETSENVLTQLYFFVATIIFLGVGGHRALIRALLDSFAAVPPLGFRITEDLVELLINLLTVSFELAIRVGGPALIALMLALLTLGFLSRTIPQLHLLSVGFPIKLCLVLLILALTITSIEPLLLEGLTAGLDGVRTGLKLGPMG